MVKSIFENVVYVVGARNSAIYNFENRKVYSINFEGTKILEKYFSNSDSLNNDEIEYINKVKETVGISEFNYVNYVFPENNEWTLNYAWLSLTERCNMKCVHCYEGNEHFEMKETLSFEKWISLLDELYEVGCVNICFIGGEPTLYSKLPELIDYAYDKGFKQIVIFTNLSYLSEKLLASIIRSKCTVKFSIYGSNEAAHEKVTQIKGSFKRLVNNLNTLIKNKVKVVAATIIMKENEYDRDNIYSFLKKFGIESNKFDEIRKVYGGCQEKHFVQRPRKMWTSPYFVANKNYFDRSININTCWYGKFTIASNGDVYPCEFERMYIYGNVIKQSIREILNSPKLKKCWGMSFKYIDFCNDCEYRFACKDCRPLVYAERGVWKDKNYRCKYNPYKGEWKK